MAKNRKSPLWHKYNKQVEEWRQVSVSEDVLPQTRSLANAMVVRYIKLRNDEYVRYERYKKFQERKKVI